ncbi:Hypp7782 [Branchiostoma lanceolatum]|uniref:Zinc finger CCHC domain-containing protein 7 n=1 Tax=Branchiostoma lanceolatum TaxID=7740 RepID=A0A8K0EFQ4_BRALA|nr:Hypp7782 [Branchiostoma lanceolatum]
MYQDYPHEDYPYQNTSSSEDEGIDSETEAELYAQVHYAEDLSTLDCVDVVEKGGNEGDNGHDGRDNKVERGCGEQNQGGTEGRMHTVGSREGDGDGDREASHVLAVTPKHRAHTAHLPARTQGGLSGSREEEGVGRTERSGKAKRSKAERRLLKTVRSVVATDLDGEHDSDGSSISNYQILDGRTITGDELLEINVVGKKAGVSGLSPGDTILAEENKTDAGGDAEHWEVDERDREVQFGKFQRSRYYRDISHSRVRCRNCDQVGHLSKVCPKPPRKSACFLCGGRDHQSFTCPTAACHFCSNPGHQTRYCKGRYRCAETVCLHCHWKGHLARDCPDKWRQYHSTTTVGAAVVRGSGDQNNNIWCFNCGTQGHFGHDCSWPPMCKYLYPTSPFVTVYGEFTHSGNGKKRKFDADSDNYRSHNKRARRDGQPYQSPHGTKPNFKDTKKSKLSQFVQTAFSKVKNKVTGKKKGPSEKKKKWLERKNKAMNSEEAYENQLMAYDLKQLDQRCKSNFKRNANKKKKKVKQKIQQGGGWTDPREWRGVQVQVGTGGRHVSLQQTQGNSNAAAQHKKKQKKDRRRGNRAKRQQGQQGRGPGATGQSKHAKNKFVSPQGFATSFRGFNNAKKQW